MSLYESQGAELSTQYNEDATIRITEDLGLWSRKFLDGREPKIPIAPAIAILDESFTRKVINLIQFIFLSLNFIFIVLKWNRFG